MKCDDSAKAFETIFYRNGQFGFFQRRLFLLISLLQALTWTVLLYLDFVYLHENSTVHCPTSTTISNEPFTYEDSNGTTIKYNMTTVIPLGKTSTCLNNSTERIWIVPNVSN